jgi:hypothetical protein
MEIIKVLHVKHVSGTRVEVHFTNGDAGVHDFSDMLGQSGVMLDPLRDVREFSRVFVQNGVLCWPTGYDIDALALHKVMQEANEFESKTGVAA